MGRKIILIISILLIVISLSGLTCVALGVDVLDLLSFEKTTTCTKEYTDEEGNHVKDTMIVTYGNKVVKVKNTNTTIYNDTTAIDFVYGFGQLFAQGFSNIEGMNVEYLKEGNNAIKMIMEVDYEKLNLSRLKDVMNEFETDSNSFYATTDITFEEFKKQSLNDYVCE